jgi:hypothetical protein
VAAIEFDGLPTVMRYGWSDSYAQPEGWLLRKYRTVGYRFMPLPEILDTIWRTGDAAWRVEIDRTGHFRFGGGYGLGLENYNPRWARFENLDHQTVRLRRGEDLLLVSKPAAAVGESELGYALFTEVGQHEDPPRHDLWSRVDYRRQRRKDWCSRVVRSCCHAGGSWIVDSTRTLLRLWNSANSPAGGHGECGR